MAGAGHSLATGAALAGAVGMAAPVTLGRGAGDGVAGLVATTVKGTVGLFGWLVPAGPVLLPVQAIRVISSKAAKRPASAELA